MKLCVALIALCAVFATVAAVPAGRNQMMFFQQQNRPLYRYPAGQALLVQRYNAPKHALRRSSQEVGAFASGDSIEGATFIQDEPIQPALQDGDAFSVAEAYPAEADDASALVAADEPAAFQPEHDDAYPQADAPAYDAPAPVAAQHDAPIAPPKKHSNKKKVSAAPAPAAAAEDSDEADDDFVPAVTKAGRPAGGAGQFPQSFFPMNFGSTSGGAIAVANSFSTGKGGAASHAVAYGSAASKKRRND